MVATREVRYDVDGLTMVAHLARPEGDGPFPAVLLGHDGIGLEHYQRSRADDLAAHGFLTLAMDYHGGQVFFGDPQGMLARAMPLLADPGRMRAIGHAALDVLLAEPGVDADRLAALGFGAGGRIVLELASAGVPFRAVAAIHSGLPDDRPEDWAGVTAAVLLCTGSEDPICSPAQMMAFARVLQEAGVDWRANIYGGAQHAFWARPRDPEAPTVRGVAYHEATTKRVWRAVLDLFDETLPVRR